MKSNRGKYRPSKEAGNYFKRSQIANLSERFAQIPFTPSPSKRPKKKRIRKDQREPELVAKTFNEWSAAGYRISKGAKAQTRNLDGVPLFGIDQVWKPNESINPISTSKPESPSTWSQPSGLVGEVLERLENRHMYIPDNFEIQEFKENDEPPW